jgi:hypothetical protein
VDSNGNAYVVGVTASADFPATQHLGPAAVLDGDGFVAKVDATGSRLEYSVVFGGRADDTPAAVAVDAAGAVYVAGRTWSGDFPTTSGAVEAVDPDPASHDEMPTGPDPLGNDGFVLKLNASGNALVYSTYLGGDQWDEATGITVDAAGRAVVVGSTLSARFPVKHAAQPHIAPSVGGAACDAFVTRLEPDGTLSDSTFLGGNGRDSGGGVAVGRDGAVYVTGKTESPDFPTTDATRRGFGGVDGFLSKVATDGTLAYSSYLGGSGTDAASAVAVNASGVVTIAGSTASPDLPATPGAFQPSLRGGIYSDGFVVRLGDGEETPVVPVVTSARALAGGKPLRIGLDVENVLPGATVVVGDDTIPWQRVAERDGRLTLKGDRLAARFPIGVAVAIRVVNAGGGSTTFVFTR